jgi:hypothetical protein
MGNSYSTFEASEAEPRNAKRAFARDRGVSKRTAPAAARHLLHTPARNASAEGLILY